jgi:hypothetical protein
LSDPGLNWQVERATTRPSELELEIRRAAMNGGRGIADLQTRYERPGRATSERLASVQEKIEGHKTAPGNLKDEAIALAGFWRWTWAGY